MISPFSSFKEFSEAKGPVYTFANNPTMIAILLVICLGITVYFFYASFTMKQEDSKPVTPATLAMLLLAGAASLIGSLIPGQPSRQPTAAYRSQPAIQRQARDWQPLAVLGLTGVGGSLFGRKKTSRRRRRSLR